MAPEKGEKTTSNNNVDYVIIYRFGTTAKEQAEARYEKLVKSLAEVGLSVTARDGGDCSVIIFVKSSSEQELFAEVYRSRTKDWLHGLRSAAPEKKTEVSLESEPLTDAERLRIVYLLITQPASEGGAGITPKQGQWENVESIFPLHDEKFNKEWIKSWSKSYSIDERQLTQLKNRYGEKIGFYFAFLEQYFTWLLFPAAFGSAAYFLLPEFSAVYAVVNCLWTIIFIEYWHRQERDLSVRWGVRGVSKIQQPRLEFKAKREVPDPVTGEIKKYFPTLARLQRQTLQIPLALLASVLLGGLITICFGIEVFISEVYDGPGKAVLVYLPTGILTTMMPTLSKLLTSFASKLNSFENYATVDEHEAAMTRKVFVFNFITSYVPIFLTAFVYVPFGALIVPHLDVFGLTVKPWAQSKDQLKAPKTFQVNQGRLRKQVIYFVVTAQIVNFLLEVITPYVKKKVFVTVKKVQSSRAAAKGGDAGDVAANDHPEEADFMAKVRAQSELDIYDVNSDLREMVMQFGYLALFSVVWPLTAVSFLINNWIELRSDAIKICVEMQRPIPWRADSIGPWLDSLGFLAWLGSLTSAALVFLFSGAGPAAQKSPWDIKAWALLLSIAFSEHIYFAVRSLVRNVLEKFESPGELAEQRERYMIRKRYMEDSLSEKAGVRKLAAQQQGSQNISRGSAEEDARQAMLHGAKPNTEFWQRQPRWEETAKVGVGIIRRAAPEAKKSK